MAQKRHGSRGHRKKRNKSKSSLTDGQKYFLQQTGELHPLEQKDTVKKYAQVKDEPDTKKPKLSLESSSESEEEEVNAFQQLMSSIGQGASAADYKSSDDDDDDDDDEEDVNDEIGKADESDLDKDDEEVDEKESVDEEDSNDSGDEDEIDLDHDSEDEDGDGDGVDDDDEEEEEEEEEKEEDTDNGITTHGRKKRNIDMDVESDDNNIDETDLMAEDDSNKDSDPFIHHFERDLQDSEADKMMSGKWEKKDVTLPSLGRSYLHWRLWNLVPECSADKFSDLHESKVKQSLCEQVAETNRTMCKLDNLKPDEILSPLQQGLFSVLNAYQDLYYSERSHVNGEEIRLVYCLHALNHALKTRSRVIAHNCKLKNKQKQDNSEYRDQGLTRPKVLLVLPFRDSALKVVNIMSSLLGTAEQVMVSNKKRFQSEYGSENEDNYRKGLKPEDFETTFSGNNDDHFRLGIAVSKRSLKLYVPFYQADIILTSPLGLRTIIGAEGEKDRDFDFLSSIEMLILDQTDVFLMQNWDHVLHMFKHLHMQPKESHDCDFSRVRMWSLNGWSHLYRQTLVFSSIATPDINAVFNKQCHNYAGKVQILRQPGAGVICQVITQTPQTFQRITCASFSQLMDARFDFFIKQLLPHHKDPVMAQTLVYIPSYFDFVRLRNYFKKEAVDFVHMSEYASDKGISRVRCDFFHRKAHFLLYTERLHFFRRFRVRGIKHIIFYDLPTYPHFYSEVCNMMKDPKRGENKTGTCTVIYSKYDAQKLAEVVGTERAAVMLNAEKSVHMFVTGDES